MAHEAYAQRYLPRWLGLAAGKSHGLSAIRMTTGGTVLLAGGGHTHALLLKRWAIGIAIPTQPLKCNTDPAAQP